MLDVVGQPLLEEALEHANVLVRYTVEQYHEFIASGLIEETVRTELIDGLLVQKDRAKAGDDLMTIGDRHRMAVLRLSDLAAQFKPYGCFLQSQLPISIPPRHEPEPDISVVRGTIEDFADHPPEARDAIFVLEVADSSLRRDLKVKLPIYAQAGIQEYIVVDLQNNVILIHRRPEGEHYAEVIKLRSGDVLELSAGGSNHVDVSVSALLG
jgi:Uma2 family endonuclease